MRRAWARATTIRLRHRPVRLRTPDDDRTSSHHLPVTATGIQPPSGVQYDIGHGRHQVVVTEVGATLRSYTVGGRAVLDGFGVDDMCDSGRGQVLAPWPNRLGDGRYSYEGRDGRAALDEPDRPQRHPRPGPLDAVAGACRAPRTCSAWAARLHPQPGYPWRLSLLIEYRLGRDGLTVTTTVTNLDRSAAPFGIGFHPYLTLSTPIDATSLAVPARRRLVTDERGLPTSTQRGDRFRARLQRPALDRRHRARHRLHRLPA